jgi:hypothetical protein
MAKKEKRRMGRCAYCGEQRGITRDHVVPRALFGRPSPPNLITVPACDACNNTKSRNDAYLRDLVTCDIYGNQHPVAHQIFQQSVLSAARQNYSVLARAARAAARLEPLYTRGGLYLGTHVSVPLEEERTTSIFMTLVRGLYYDHRKQVLPQHYDFEIRRYDPWDFDQFWRQIQHMSWNGPRCIGDVFGCAYLHAAEDPFTTYWLLWFYDRVFFSVAATNPELLEDPTRRTRS